MGTVCKTVNHIHANRFEGQSRMFSGCQDGILILNKKSIDPTEPKSSPFGNTERVDTTFEKLIEQVDTIFEKLMEQYEERLKEKDAIIQSLKEQNADQTIKN